MAQQKKLHNLLSIIVPAYKQQKTIKRDIQNLKKVMDEGKVAYELIVVIDGQVDKTWENAKSVRSPKVKVVGYQHNHGKGYAVRFGMSHSKGNYIAFVDAGMDLAPEYLLEMFAIIKTEHADIVLGSKLHPGSRVSYPYQRKILSVCYRLLVKTLFGLTTSDTQVGMKVFRRKVLEDVLPRLLVKAYAFDIEMLAVANYLGYSKIREAPVELKFQKFSSITSKSFIRIVLSMMKDTLAVFYRLKILGYYSNENKRKWKFDPELNFRVNI